MISRETSRLIAELTASAFTKRYSPAYSTRHRTGSDSDRLYDFLYDHDFPGWLCNAVKRNCSGSSTRSVKEFLMKLHTGESSYEATEGWSWAQRGKLGQQYLRQLAEAIIDHWQNKAIGSPN